MRLIGLRTLFALVTACNLFSSEVGALITVGAFETPSSARDVEVVGDIAYVAAGGSGLRMIAVSNPVSPVNLGGLITANHAFEVEVVGNLAYVADHYSGLRVIDTSNPAFPVEIGDWGSALISRTLLKSPILRLEACHGAKKEVLGRVRAGSGPASDAAGGSQESGRPGAGP